MSDIGSSGDGKDDKSEAGNDAALSERMHALGRKLDKIDAESDKTERGPADSSGSGQGMGLALRVASEFASGVLVGAGLGWLIDRWLGTSPWGMIILLLLGFGAGILNVLRAVGKVAQPEERLDIGKPKR